MCVFRKIDSKTAKTLCEEYKFSFNIVLEDDYYKILDSNGFIIGVIVYTVGENEIDVDYFEVVQKKQGYGKKIINNFISQKINNGIKKIALWGFGGKWVLILWCRVGIEWKKFYS